jgi:predicted MFS family arabinose efflux permease
MSTGTIVSKEANSIAALQTNTVKSTGRLAVVFVFCFLSTFFSGIISMLMSVYLPVVAKDLLGNVTEEKMNTISAWINCVFIFGWMFGGIAWGVICDRIGRAKSVVLSTAFFGLIAAVTGLSSSWLLVSACRFLSGFGIGGVLVTTSVFVSELWPKKKKAIVLGIVSLAMPVGFFAAGAINNFTEDWRTAFRIGVVPVALAVIAYFILPESNEWKTDKQSVKEKVSARKQLFAVAYRKNLLIGSVIFGTMLIGLWAIFGWAPTWVQSISTSSNIQEQRGGTMMILAGGGIAGSFFSGWIVNITGLRKTMMMCFAVCFLMTFVVFKLNTTVSTITFVEMAILAFFFGISQGALAVYIPSLFPTGICASATGFCFNVGRLFTGTVVFFIGALVIFLGGYGNAVFTFSFIFVIGFIATFLSREKKDRLPTGNK